MRKGEHGGCREARAPSTLPLPYPAHVNVYKIRAGVIAHATALQHQGSPAHVDQFPPGNTDIGCLAIQMHAVFGHTTAARREHGIGGGRAVAGNNMERLPGVNRIIDAVQQIKQRRRHILDFVVAVIAQYVVDVGKCLGNVFSLRPVDCLEVFSRMRVIKS